MIRRYQESNEFLESKIQELEVAVQRQLERMDSEFKAISTHRKLGHDPIEIQGKYLRTLAFPLDNESFQCLTQL